MPLTNPTGGALASFSAHKNGSNQASIATATATKVTFGTEIFDIGGYFDNATNYRWTPPAGKVCISWQVEFSAGLQASSITQVTLRKNGSDFKIASRNDPVVNDVFNMGGTIIDQANGTDFYEVFVFGQSSGTITLDGTATLTWFSGSSI